MRTVGQKSNQRVCATDGCHGDKESEIAESPRYWLDQPLFAGGKTNVIDYYRDPVPIVISALFASDNTISVVFSETVDTTVTDFDAAGLTENFISGSPGSVTEINIGSTSDETGTLDIGAGVTSVTNGTPLTAVTTQTIWSGRE